MADAKYKVKVGDAEYLVTAPDADTAWQWAYTTHQQEASTPAPAIPAAPAALDVEAPNRLEKMGGLGKMAAEAANLPLSAVAGLAGSSKTFTDVFGANNAASKSLNDISQLALDLRSAQSRKDAKAAAQVQKEAEGKGFWEEVKAAAKAFTYSPLETTASVAGSAVPYIAASLGAAALAPETGGASLAGLYGLVGGATAGGVSGAGMIKGDIYDALYSAAMEHGATEAQAATAAKKAQEYIGPNTDQIALGTALGAAAAATGLPRQLTGIVARNAERRLLQAAAEATARKGVVKGVVKGAFEEAIPEALQAGQERYAQNIAQKRAGYDVDPFAGVAGQAAFEGIASLIPGGIGGGKEAISENEKNQPLPQSRAQLRANRELARQARAAGIDLDDESIGATYNGLVAKYVAEGDTEAQALIKASRDLPSLIGVAPENLGEVPGGSTTAAPAPTVRAVNVNQAAATPEPVRTPAQEVTPEALAAAMPEIDAGFAEYVDEFNDEYGVTELTPEVRQAAAEMIVAEPNIAPYDALHSVLQNVQQAAPTTTAVPTTPLVAPTIDMSAPLKERTTIAQQLVADTVANDETLQGLGITDRQQAMAKNQLARGAHPDAVAALTAVLNKTQLAALNVAPQPAMEIAAAPAPAPVPTPVDTQAIEPVTQAIEQATASTGSNVPSLAETAARDTGIGGELAAPEDLTETVDQTAVTQEEPAPQEQEQVQEEQLPAEPTVGEVARERNLDPGMFTEGVRDVERGAEPLTDEQILDAGGQEALDAYKAGIEYATQQGATAEPAPQVQEEVANLPAAIPETPKSSRKLDARIMGLDYLFDDLQEQFDDVATHNEAKAFVNNLIKEDIINEDEAVDINETLRDRSPEALSEVKRGLQNLLDTVYNDRLRKIEREELQGQRYRREGAGQGVTKEAVQDYVNGLISSWKANLNVNVINSVDDLPANLKEAVIRDGAQEAQGFVTAEGDIYILASNLNKVSDAASTIYHEGLGHLGLRALFNERLDMVLQQIYDGNKKLRDEADTWFDENTNAYPEDSNPRLRALEEVLAIQSEEGRVDASIWAKLTAVIKDMGRRLGIKSNFSDNEVRAILAMAHDQIINGPRESTVVKGLRYMINAWHGSPHNFDRFSLEHIGSGEGAQVYGWGLYFSSSKSIAEWYKNNLSKDRVAIDTPSGVQSAASYNTPLLNLYLDLKGNKQSYPATAVLDNIRRGISLDDAIKEMYADYSHFPQEDLAKVEAVLRAANPRYVQHGGKLYNVNIDTDQDHMLDWDKPMEEQSDYVQERLDGLGIVNDTTKLQQQLQIEKDDVEYYIKLYNDILSKNTQVPTADISKDDLDAEIAYRDNLRDAQKRVRQLEKQLQYPFRGKKIYQDLAARLGSDKAASKALLETGITGTTYIGGSSSERNYVVFDDSAIAVANKYQRKKKTGPSKELLRAERMLARSHNPNNMNEATSTIMKVQRSKRRLEHLMSIIPNVISTKRGRYMLQFLTPADVIRLAKRASSALGGRLDKVAAAMAEMRDTRAAMQVKVQERAYRWNKFNVRFKEGGRFLSDMINLATLYNIDPRLAANAQDFLAQDAKIKAIKADAKLGAIAKNNRIKTRTDLVEAVYKRWDALASRANGKGEGQKIFDMAAKAYREIFNRQLAGTVTRIEQSELSDDRKVAAIKSVKALFAEAEKIGLYFPLGREGDFWLRFGAGKDREYYQFTSQIERDLAMRERHDEMTAKGEKRSLDELIYAGEVSSGDNANTLQDDVVNNDSTRLLQGLLNELDAGAISDLKAVKEQLTEMYLQTMPQSAQSAAMRRREGITGFSANTLRTFVTTQSAAASRLARLEHADNIRNNLATSYALIQNDPEQDKLKPYVDQMAEFAGRQLAPTQGNPWLEFMATAANRATFLYMLTSLKTAIIQPLQLTTTGMSVLARDYGWRAPAMAFRIMGSFDNLLGTAKLDEDGNVIEKYGQPSMNDGGYINDEPNPEMRRVLKALWTGGNERGVFSTNLTGDITGDRQLDVGVYDNPVLESTRKTLSFVHNFMTGAGFHTERISREVMFMSAARLEYEKLRKAGVSEAEATKRAEQRGAELTIEALFDYGQDAKSMAARGPIGRIFFQFTVFPMNMTSLLIRNFYNTVRLKASLQERRDASIVFFGALASTFMWAGATGLPLYTLFMGLADLARELFRPLLEGEDEDPRMYDAASGNPMAYASMDLWFRQWFLPNMLGDGWGQRAVEMGPISAATDLNFSMSLSLNQMFFRDEQPADNVADAVRNLVMSTGLLPAAGMAKQMLDGIDYMLDGKGDRAAEKLMPYNFLRQPLIAARLQREGYVTPTGLELKPAEFYTVGKIIGQATGFGSTEVAEAQKRNILFSRATDKVDAVRSKTMQGYGEAYLKYLAKPTEENRVGYEKAMERWDEYNMEYGAINPITARQMKQSVIGRAESRAVANQLGGIQTDKVYRGVAQDMLQQGK
jgi:hypothetical protein